MRIGIGISVCFFSIGMLACAQQGGDIPARIEVQSPDQAIRVEFLIREANPCYSVSYRGREIVQNSVLGLELKDPFTGGFRVIRVSNNKQRLSWQPLYGERQVIPDNFNGMVVELAEAGKAGRLLNVELRAYDEGVAFRYNLPDSTAGKSFEIEREKTEFRFVQGCMAYPIYGGEQTFPTEPLAIPDVKKGAKVPLTMSIPGGFASVLEACVVNYPRMSLTKTADGTLAAGIAGKAEVTSGFSSPWRIILLGENEGKLIEHEHLVLNLNPPCAIDDTSWIVPGKTISNEGACPLKMAELKKLADISYTNGFRYMQLDWGWYGTEWSWTEKERETFRKTMPNMAANTDWVPNTEADPYKAAKGPVPYRADWKSVTQVDLDVAELVKYLKERRMGLALYIEAGKTLRAHDIDKLFGHYEGWGLAGLKPGFVRYGSQENTEWIRRMVQLAAKHKLWLCIHDGHVPDGMERTYPNLMISEGGGGQEGGHPASHDVTLPFTRCLAGAFDYTPSLYTKGKSHAHMLAFFVVYYGPAQTVRGGLKPWSGKGIGGAEIEFVRRVPVTWDDTRVLDAKIGRRIVTARRNGETWFIGGMTGSDAQDVDISLDFLESGKSYTARIYSDDSAAAKDGWCPAKMETRTVKKGDRVPLKMEKAGGCVMILEPTGIWKLQQR